MYGFFHNINQSIRVQTDLFQFVLTYFCLFLKVTAIMTSMVGFRTSNTYRHVTRTTVQIHSILLVTVTWWVERYLRRCESLAFTHWNNLVRFVEFRFVMIIITLLTEIFTLLTVFQTGLTTILCRTNNTSMFLWYNLAHHIFCHNHFFQLIHKEKLGQIIHTTVLWFRYTCFMVG